MSSRPAIMRRAVDFPQPDGPTRTTNSPSGMSRFILSTATTSSPKTLVTSSRVTSAIHFLLPFTRTTRPRCLPGYLPLYLATFYLMPTLCAQVVCFLHRQQSPHGLLEARTRDLPRPYGLHDGIISVGLLLRRAGDYKQIRPRPDGLHRSIGDGSSARSPSHGEIVRDDHAVEAKIATQHVYGLPGEARGKPGVYGRVHEMTDHYHGHPGVDGGRERR